jgi:DNA modification methylase
MTVRILQGDCRDVLKTLPDESVHCVVTSPPYFGLRDYGVAGQIGLEDSPQAFVDEVVGVMHDARRVLRDDGTAWVNIGDTYAGSWGAQGRQGKTGQMANRSVVQARSIDAHPQRSSNTGTIRHPGVKPKDLYGIPWMLAFALRADGWWLRQDIIWHKPNPMPESVTDRCTKSHEYIFLLAKSERYYYDATAIAEPAAYAGEQLGVVRGTKRRADAMGVSPTGNERPGADADIGDTRNKRSVWSVTTKSYEEAHFATFPPDLIEPCILAGCPAGGLVLDPFGGAGTTGLVADRLQRDAILIELNPEYAAMARKRIQGDSPLFAEVA